MGKQDSTNVTNPIVDFFQKKFYKDVPYEELKTKMFSDPSVYNKALELIHKDSYSNISLEDFRNGITKKYGDPFARVPKEKQAQPAVVKPVSAQAPFNDVGDLIKNAPVSQSDNTSNNQMPTGASVLKSGTIEMGTTKPSTGQTNKEGLVLLGSKPDATKLEKDIAESVKANKPAAVIGNVEKQIKKDAASDMAGILFGVITKEDNIGTYFKVPEGQSLMTEEQKNNLTPNLQSIKIAVDAWAEKYNLDQSQKDQLYYETVDKIEVNRVQKQAMTTARFTTKEITGIDPITVSFLNSKDAKVDEENIRNLTEQVHRKTTSEILQDQALIQNDVKSLREGKVTQLETLKKKLENDVANGKPPEQAQAEFLQAQTEINAQIKSQTDLIIKDYTARVKSKIISNNKEVQSQIAKFSEKYGKNDALKEAFKVYGLEYQKAYNDSATKLAEKDYENFKTINSLGDQFNIALASGTGNVIRSAGGFLGMVGMVEAGRDLAVIGEQLAANNKIPAVEFDYSQLADPTYLTTQIGQSLPYMAAIAAAAYPTGGLGFGVSTLAYTTTMASLESGGVYQDAIQRGEGEALASQKANDTFVGNMQLIGLNAMQLAPFFGKVKGLTATLAMEASSEVVEELYQGYLSQKAINPDLEFMDFALSKQGGQAAVTAAAMSVIMTGAAQTKEIVSQKARETMQSQQLANMISSTDLEKTVASLEILQKSGQLTEEEFIKAKEKAIFIASNLKILDGLNNSTKMHAVNLANDINTTKANLPDDPNNPIAIAKQKQVGDMQKELNDVISGTAPSYGYYVGSEYPVTINKETIGKLIQNPSFLESIATNQSRVEIIGDSKTEKMLNEAVEAHLKDKENQEAIDKKVEANQQRLGITPDILNDIPPVVINTISRLEEGVPVDPVQLNEASEYLYDKYNRLVAMKKVNNRMLTTKQINELQEGIAADIDMIERAKDPEYKGIQITPDTGEILNPTINEQTTTEQKSAPITGPTETVPGDQTPVNPENGNAPAESQVAIKPKSIADLSAENKSTLPKIPTSKVFVNEVSTLKREETVGLNEFLETATTQPTQEISISEIIPTQKSLTIPNLEATTNVTNTEEPVVVAKKDGKYYIVDGHHRIANKILAGDEKIEAVVFDPINKTLSEEGTKEELPKVESNIQSWIDEFKRTKDAQDFVKMEELYNKIKVVQNGTLQGRIKDPIVLENTITELNNLKKDIEQYANNWKETNQPKETSTPSEAPKSSEAAEKKVTPPKAENTEYVNLFSHYNTNHGSTNTIAFNKNDGKLYQIENYARGKIIETTIEEAAKELWKTESPRRGMNELEINEAYTKEVKAKYESQIKKQIDQAKVEAPSTDSLKLDVKTQIDKLVDALNEGAKGKEIYALKGISAIKSQGEENLTLLAVENGNGTKLFNVVDSNGDIPSGFVANWRIGPIVAEELGISEPPATTSEESTNKQPIKIKEVPVVKTFGTEAYKNGENQLLGRSITKTIANGEEITGVYKVVSANDILASHNEETFSETKGFPTTAQGTTVNDRDYKNDVNAQAQVVSMAQQLDDRAIEQTPVVSKDGIVLSGNNRTMSRKLAAKNETDKKYMDALIERADLYGIDPDGIYAIENPILVFETSNDLPYTTETFAKFNKSEGKEKSPIDKAIEISKTASDKLKRGLIQIYGDAERLSDVTSQPKKVKELMHLLESEGVLQQSEMPRYFNVEKMVATREGVSFVETLLMGSALSEKVIRALDAENMGDVRNKVISSLVPLVKNNSLGENSIVTELENAIQLINKVKNSKLSMMDYLSQSGLFQDAAYTQEDIAIAVALSASKFKDFLNNYNNNAGVFDMFANKSRGKKDIIGDYINQNLSTNEKQKVNQYTESNAGFNGRATGQSPQSIRSGQGQNPTKKVRGPSGGLASSKGMPRSVDDLITKTGQTADKFNFADRVKAVLNKIGVPVAEKGLPSRYLGVFIHRNKNIRVQALFDIFVASHETAHFISFENKIGDKVMRIVGYSKDGKPKYDPALKALRKALTDIYIEYYPGAAKEHSLKLRVEEGIAVLLENYLYDPTGISNKYGILVDTFLNPTGEFYHPKFTELLDELNKVIKDYSDLTPAAQIGSRIVRDKKLVEKDTGFTLRQKLTFEVVTKGEPLKRYDKFLGKYFSEDAAEVQYFRWLGKGSIIANWIKGDAPAMVPLGNGDWYAYDISVAKYLKLIDGKEDLFDAYLVARRALGDHNLLTDLQNEVNDVMSLIEDDENPDPELLEQLNELLEKFSRQEKIVKNDQFSIQQVTAIVGQYEEEFKDAVKIYDQINQKMIDFAENTELISGTSAQAYRDNKTYAAFNRFINDELLDGNPVAGGGSSQKKVTGFKSRSGSNLEIVSPVYSQINHVAEVISKGLQNNIWRQFADNSNQSVEVARRFEKTIEVIRVPNPQGGFLYPQDKDPNLIKVFRKGSRAYYKAAPEIKAFAQTLQPHEIDMWLRVLSSGSSLFTRMTTSAFPLFPLVNLPVDTISAAVNTKTGIKPGVAQVNSTKGILGYVFERLRKTEKLSTALDKIGTKKLEQWSEEDKNLFKKYLALGGKRQTFASQYDLSPEESIDELQGRIPKGKKALNWIEDNALGLLEMPSNISEYMTRFAEFKKAKEKGDSDDLAMFKASHVSVPFQQGGNFGGPSGQAFIRSLPYFGATVQVAAKYLDQVEVDPSRVISASAAVMAATVTMAALAMAASSDEDKRLLAELPPSEFAKAIYIPAVIWGGKGFMRLRIPEQIGAITGLAYLAVIDAFKANNFTGGGYLSVLSQAVPRQFNIFGVDNAQVAALAYIPQLVKPGLMTMMNKVDYPRLMPLVPDGLSNKQPEYQYNQYTSKVAKFTGQLMGVAPIKVDYFVKSQFGSLPAILLGSKEVKNPLIRQEQDFIMRGESYSDFYSDLDFYTKQYNSRKSMENLNPEELIKIESNYKVYNVTREILSEMRNIAKDNPLPEDVKQTAFETLKKLRDTDDPYTEIDEVQKLGRAVSEFEKTLSRKINK